MGNNKFAATYRKNGCAACGESAASTPTNVIRIRIGTFVLAGASRRADRVVRPYGCIPFRIGAFIFVTLCGTGGAEPSPTQYYSSFIIVPRHESGGPVFTESPPPYVSTGACLPFACAFAFLCFLRTASRMHTSTSSAAPAGMSQTHHTACRRASTSSVCPAGSVSVA